MNPTDHSLNYFRLTPDSKIDPGVQDRLAELVAHTREEGEELRKRAAEGKSNEPKPYGENRHGRRRGAAEARHYAKPGPAFTPPKKRRKKGGKR